MATKERKMSVFAFVLDLEVIANTSIIYSNDDFCE